MLYTLYILLHWKKNSVASYCSQGKVPNSYYSLSVWATCFLFTFPASAPWNQAPQRQANGSFRPRAFTRLSLLCFTALPGEPFHYSLGCGFVPLAGSSRHFLTFRPPSNPSPVLPSAYLSAVITQTPGSPQPSLFGWLFYLKMTAT